MWEMPKFRVVDGKAQYENVVVFSDANHPPIQLTEGQTYVVKPGPWPHVGRKGVFVPVTDDEIMLDENQDETDPEFLFFPDPRSLELVKLQ